MSYSPTWINTAAPSPVASLAVCSVLWALGTDNSLNTWNPSISSWNLQLSPPSTFTFVSAAASDGSLIGVDVDGNVYVYDGSWNLVASDVSFAAIVDANTFVLVDSLGVVTRWSFGLPTTLPSGPVKIAVGSSASVMFGLDGSGNIYSWDETLFSWELISGALVQIQVSPAGNLYGTSASGEGWSWDGSDWTYIVYPLNPTTPLSFLGFDGSSFWGISTSGDVWTGV